ncbi:MAG: glycosyl transferase family 2 [Gemmatimonadetes bacterium]|jgi:glycosyltransferase involved in cell wall biosynthesis|nr:glycosyl transferase family 2 [Gemmatimonadota bacterium]
MMTGAPPVHAGPFTPRRATDRRVDVSVLVPAKDEAENLPLFMELAATAFAASPHIAFEVVVVDDGSVDGTWTVLQRLQEQYSFLRAVRHRARRGIADALRTGYLNSTGPVLVFYPADLQFMPVDIPRLVAPILADDADMVTGFKEGKYEKAFVSGIYNGLSRSLFNVPVKDLNSVKAYRREIMDGLPVRPDWHRYMIVIAAEQGYTVTEIPVPLYPRNAGRSKFGLSRIPIGVLDMLSVWFELKFGKKPLLLFGMMGAGLFALGSVAFVGALVALMVDDVGYRWMWTLIQTCLVLGSVFFATGLLGEQIAGQRAEVRELRRQLDDLKVRSDA